MAGKGREKGEFILLGVFALFVGLFLFDIRTLPLEGKLLSYLLTPFVILTMALCLREALAASRSSTGGEEALEGREADEPAQEPKQRYRVPAWRFAMTLAAGFFLFFSIYLVGFYLGSGLMLLLWFAFFRRFQAGTVALIVGTPLLLYLLFEVFLDMGLPQGEIVYWLGW